MEKRVLVCDDDPGIAEVLSIIFSSNFCDVKVLSNGNTILPVIKSYQPHLILLDIWMPGKTGDTIANELKHDEGLKSIPVIFISGLPNLPELAKKIPVEGYIHKPFDIEEIESLIPRFLP